MAVPDLLDFTNTAQVSHDYALEQMTGTIEFIQAIYIDNSNGANAVSIIFSGTLFRIQCRASRQGIWPVIAAVGGLGLTASATIGMKVPILLFNVQQPYFIWDV